MVDSQILIQYRALLAECFIANIQLDNEDVTKEESEVLQDLEPDEVYENFKDLIKSLLEFKRYVRKAEENEEHQIENSNISTPAPEETQQFHNSLKQLSETNEDLKKKIQILQVETESLKKKLEESEKIYEGKETSGFKAVHSESEKTQAKGDKSGIHHRVCSDLVVDNKSKCTMIKSVKFEYFPSGKVIPVKVKTDKGKKTMNSNGCSPEKIKAVHSRSTSNMFIFDNSKNSRTSGRY